MCPIGYCALIIREGGWGRVGVGGWGRVGVGGWGRVGEGGKNS